MHTRHLNVVREKLRSQVPLIRHMGVDVVHYEPGKAVVEAPLEPNLNTHGTAFGGSLYCVSTMAGWALVHLTLMDAGFEPQVWVTRGEVDYLKPVTGTIRAVAGLEQADTQALISSFAEHGKARVTVPVVIGGELEQALRLQVSFAARR